MLDDLGAPATIATTGGRFYGFVVSVGLLPATVAASWLANTWDQNAGITTSSPLGAYIDNVALRWTLESLGLSA